MPSPSRHRPPARWQRQGMTMIEVLVVIALIAALMALGGYGMGMIGGATARSEANKFGGVIRYVYGQAATHNQSFQLIINLDTNEYHAEHLDTTGPLSREELVGETLRSEEEIERDSRRAARIDREDQQFAGALTRTPVQGSLIEDTTLPDNIAFLGVMTSHHEELQTEGIATINFFPSGLVEHSIIYMGMVDAEGNPEGAVFSIIVEPLTGHTEVVGERVEVDRAFFEPEEE